MGIFDALNTAVSGLQAQSFALQNISGNIANSQTTAFKGTDTQFRGPAVRPGATPSAQTSGSVIASSSSTIAVQGDIQSTSVGTNMAINGDGFFVVEKPTGFTGGIPELQWRQHVHPAWRFPGAERLSGQWRRLLPDGRADRSAPPTTRTGSVPSLLQFQNSFLPAQATTLDQLRGQSADRPDHGQRQCDVPGSDLLNPVISFPTRSPSRRSRATMTGIGATLTPDAAATVTGTADTTGYVVGGRRRQPHDQRHHHHARRRADTGRDRDRDQRQRRRRFRDGECEHRRSVLTSADAPPRSTSRAAARRAS